MKVFSKRRLTRSLLLLCTSTLLFSCNSNKQEDIKGVEFPAFSKESHRGGRGVMPENSIPAMLYSLSLDGITTLEMDVHVTADKKLVLSHDPYLNPLFTLDSEGNEIEDKQYAIHQMTYEELKQFDTGTKDNKNFPQQKSMKVSIPLLGDVFDATQKYIKDNGRDQVFYNIETKSSEKKDNILNSEPEEFVKLLMGVIEEKGVTDYVVIQSFDVRTLQILHRDYPEVKTSYLVNGKRRQNYSIEEDFEFLGFTPFIYSPPYQYITKEEIDKCREKGVKVIVWTPNTKEDVERLTEMGVDGIITDYPELLLD